MNKILKILGFKDVEQKARDYLDMRREQDLLKSDIDDLCEIFSETKSMRDESILKSDDEFVRNRIQERYSNFMKGHINEILKAKERKRKIDEKMYFLKKDERIKKAIEEIEQHDSYQVIKRAYRGGKISHTSFNNIIKAKQGKVHYSDVIVYNEKGEILFLQRKDDSDFEPSKWGLPGGHVDMGEEHIEAAVRELQEETGIEVKEKDLTKVGEYNDNDVMIAYYTIHLNETPEVVLDESEHRHMKWCVFNGLEKGYMIKNLYTNLENIVYPGLSEIRIIKKAVDDGGLNKDVFKDLLLKAKDEETPSNGTIKQSTREGKKAMVWMDGKWHHFGDAKMKHNYSEEAREAATARHKKNLEGSDSRSKAFRVYWNKYWKKGGSVKKTDTRVEKAQIDTLQKAFEQGLIEEDVLKKAKRVYADNALNRKLKRVGQTYGSDKQEEPSKDKPSKDKPSKESDEPKQPNKSVEDHAKEASGKALEEASKNAKDPEVRTAAHKELDRREKEEKVQEESKDTQADTKDSESDKTIPERDDNKAKDIDIQLKEIESQIREKRKILMDLEDVDEINRGSQEVVELGKKFNELKREKSAIESGVTKEDADNIFEYTGNSYREVNKSLREDNVSTELQEKINKIDNALSKLPKYEGTVHRGMSIPKDINEMLKEWKKGGIVTMKSFTSTSKDKSVAETFGDFQMEIQSKAGRGIDFLSDVGGESEILFKTGAKFKVTSIKVEKYKDPFRGDVIQAVYVKLSEI